MPIKKILIIPSNAQSYPFIKASGPDGDKTVKQYSGFYLQKLAKPLQKLLNAGHEVIFYEHQCEQDLVERMRHENGLSRPRPFSTISDNELTTFMGLFIPGGHAPLLNLDANAEIGRIMHYFHKENKPTTVICHGLFALLSTKQAGDRSFVYAGYKISSCSNTEKKAEELLWGGQVEKVESRLRDEGAIMVDSAPERTYRMTLHRDFTETSVIGFFAVLLTERVKAFFLFDNLFLGCGINLLFTVLLKFLYRKFQSLSHS